MQDGRKSYAKEMVRRSTGREDLAALLRELYVDKRHSQAEIAEALGVGRMAIGTWLREYGITRDDRQGVALAIARQAAPVRPVLTVVPNGRCTRVMVHDCSGLDVQPTRIGLDLVRPMCVDCRAAARRLGDGRRLMRVLVALTIADFVTFGWLAATFGVQGELNPIVVALWTLSPLALLAFKAAILGLLAVPVALLGRRTGQAFVVLGGIALAFGVGCNVLSIAMVV